MGVSGFKFLSVSANYIASVERVSALELPLFLGARAIDIVHIERISDEFRHLVRRLFHVRQLVFRIERVMPQTFRLEFHDLRLAPFNILVRIREMRLVQWHV